MKKLFLLLTIITSIFLFTTQVSALANVQLQWQGDTSDHKTITFGDELTFIADITTYDPPINVLLTLKDETGNIKKVYLDESQYTNPEFGFSSYSQTFTVSQEDYETLGDFEVSLQTMDQSGTPVPKSLTFTVVRPTTVITVDASAEPMIGEAPLNVAFGCNANGGFPEYDYKWTFGDGDIEPTQMSHHVYNVPGTYTATCTAIDNFGNEGNDNLQIIVNEPTVTNHNPIADFTISPNPSLIGDELILDASNSYDPDGDSLTYEWDIGNDGDIEFTGKIVHKTFYQAKNYPIRLIVSDENNKSEIIKYAVVEEYYEEFLPSAYANPDNGFIPFITELNCEAGIQENIGLSSDYSYKWLLDNGSVLYGATQIVTYNEAGLYRPVCEVTQSATNIIKQTSVSLISLENLSYEDFAVEAVLDKYEGIVPLTINGECSVTAEGNGLSGDYKTFWWVDNGELHMDEPITYTFDHVDNHNVTCGAIQIQTGIDKYSEKSINVLDVPYESFDVSVVTSPDRGFAPLNVQAVCNINSGNDGQSGIYAINMNFGDASSYDDEMFFDKSLSHIYQNPGNYTVTCVVTQVETGIVQAASSVIEVIPVFYESFDVVVNVSPDRGFAPLEISGECNVQTLGDGFNGTYAYVWDMGDSAVHIGSNFVHNYSEVGVYTPACIVTQVETGVVKSSYVNVEVEEHPEENHAPIAKLKITPEIIYEGDVITFDASDSFDPDGDELTYYWMIYQNNDTILFEGYDDSVFELLIDNSGNVTVKLTVTDVYDAFDSKIDNFLVFQENYENFTLSYGVTPLFGIAPQIVVGTCVPLNNYGIGLEATYATLMNFGDGTIVKDETTYSHTYVEAGNYTFTCEVTQVETGIKKDASTQVIIEEKIIENMPPMAFLEGPIFGEVRDIMIFNASNSYDPEGKPLTYQWFIAGNLVQEGNNSLLSTKFSELGNYQIMVKVFDVEGLFDEESLNVVITKTIIPLPEHKPELDNDVEFTFEKIGIMGFDVNRVHPGNILYVTMGASTSEDIEGRPSLIIPELGLKSTGALSEVDSRESMTASIWIPPETQKGYYSLRVGFKSDEIRKGEIRWFKVE